MIKATLDVNVLVSGFPARSGPPLAVLQRWAAVEFQLVLSEQILDGTERAWSKSYFRSRFAVTDVRWALRGLRARATIVVPDPTVRGVADDEEDDLVVATAVAGEVDDLVTGDRGLLAIRRYRGISIITPRAFLDLLEQAAVENSEEPPNLGL